MQTSLIKDIPPSKDLQEYVRKYQVFRFLFDASTSPPIKFHAPRPEHCITFYIRDAQKFSYHNSLIISTYPPCVINGMYTVPIYRYGGSDFCAIKVILQPSVLFQLIQLPLKEITNNFINAEEIWGNKIRLRREISGSSNRPRRRFVALWPEPQIRFLSVAVSGLAAF